MAYTFDGINKIISFDESTTEFDVRDLWSRYVDWMLVSDNSKYVLAMRNVGGDPLPGSKSLGLTYFMLNGWKIRPFSETHVLSINGNIYSEDGSSPFVPTVGDYNVTIINTVSNLIDLVAVDGGIAPSANEIADAVWDEALTGHSSTNSAGKILSDVLWSY
jgi:hypothetical protein